MENITDDTDLLQDLEINSAHLVDIILDLEDEFDIEISDEQAEKMLNVGASIAVIEEAPFHLDLFIPPVPLVRNGTTNLKITAKRAEGFDKKIKVVLPWKPPGVGSPVSVDIPAGKNEAILTLNANGEAPVAKWQLVVTGESITDRGVVRR